MKIDMSSLDRFSFDEVKVGNVYPAKGGRLPAVWLVVAVRDTRVHLLGIDRGGNIVGTETYGKHAMEERPCIGFCDGLEELELKIRQVEISQFARYGAGGL